MFLLKQGNSSLSKGCNVGNKSKHAFALTPKHHTMKTIRWHRNQSTVNSRPRYKVEAIC